MRAQYATRAYSNTTPQDVPKTEVSGLVVLLFEKACSCLKTAALIPINDTDALDLTDRLAMKQFHKATSKAMQIVVALREMLDMENGGGTSTQLAETYTIIANNIWSASKSQDTVSLTKIHSALCELGDAWRTLAAEQHRAVISNIEVGLLSFGASTKIVA